MLGKDYVEILANAMRKLFTEALHYTLRAHAHALNTYAPTINEDAHQSGPR